jgi:hypothetical protein
MQNSITRPATSFAKKLALCLFVLSLAACSLARLGYSNGDTILYWWLDGYVGFNASERPWVQQRIDKLFAWHRHTELKEYVVLLAHGQQRLLHEITKEEVLADYDEVTKCGDRIIDEAAPDMADLALAMDGDNLTHLRQRFESNNDKFRRDYLHGTAQDKQEYRFKTLMEWAEYWFGDFSDEQEAVIRKASDQRPLNNELWAADRIQRQQGLITLIKQLQLEKPSHDVATARIKAYVHDNYLLRASATPEMKVFFEASKDAVAQLTVVIVNITTPKQKEHANVRLQQWIDDFNVLADKT